MYVILSYLISITVIVISVLVTLYFKSELERMFREKKSVIAFHICNVLIILMLSFAAHTVTTYYIIGNELKLARHLLMLLFMVLPIYVLAHFTFEEYKYNNRKYTPTEDGKVLIINQKYLRRK
jgi:hypothetical protein